MAKESLATVARRRLLGLTLLVTIAGLLALSVAFYDKAFTPITTVTLLTDTTGNQLASQSDVKVRGIIVGEVRKITSTGSGAKIELALDPNRTAIIPSNVSAQLLPKTLFGERYVALVLPSDPARAIRGGDVIPQDRSSSSIEVEKVLNDLLPLLQAVQPAELNSTLTALAQALSGRGEELGQNLAALNTYLTQLNPHVSTLVDDLGKLGQVADVYNAVAPDLLSALTNLQTTSRTIAQNGAQLDALLRSGLGTANQLSSFFDLNGQRIIAVAASSLPLLKVLAEYSPEFPCLAAGLAKSEVNLEGAFGGQTAGPKALNITLEVVKPRGKYVPADLPVFGAIPGPNCQGLPNPQVPFPADGYGSGRGLDGAAAVGDSSSGALPSVDRTALAAAGITTSTEADLTALNTAGSTTETTAIAALVAGRYGTSPAQVPGITTLLAGPLLRGSEVTVS